MWYAATARAHRVSAPGPIVLVVALVSLFPSGAGAGQSAIPTRPSKLALTGADAAQLSLAWRPAKAREGRRVAGYALYLNGARVRTTRSTRVEFRSLRCQTVYTVAVRAFDTARRLSPPAKLTASTAACRPGARPAPPTSVAPTATGGTTITVAWRSPTGGSDATGYRLELNGADAGATTETTHTFAELSCGTAYTVGVQAVDAAGNESTAQSVTATTDACVQATSTESTEADLALTTTTVTTTADARVAESSPSSNYGSSSYIRVDAGGDPDVQSYLQFPLASLTGTVKSAKLRAFATSGSSNGPAVHATAAGWSERGITWNTRPAVGASSADVGAVVSGTWVEWDVTPLVTGAGTYAFALVGASSDGLNLSSREGGYAAQLVVTTFAGGGTAPDTSAPTQPANLAATSTTESSLTFTWTASTDDTGVAGYTVYRDGGRIATTSNPPYTLSGLNCGTTYRLGVDAYDGAGNASEQTTVSATTAPCPAPGAAVCDKVASPTGSDSSAGTFASPFRTPQKLAGSLTVGQTGCLRGGHYSASGSYVLDVSRGGTTIRSYPGERARLVGIVQVKNSAGGLTLSHLTFEGTGGSNTVKVYAPDVVIEANEITNLGRGNSCMILGSNSGYGQAARVIVRGNRFHDCGSAANDNKDHGIYAQNVLDGQIVENVFWNSAAYAIQLYPNAQRTRFAHNVVDGDAPSVRGGVLFGGSSSYASSNNVVENNVITYAETYNITSTWSGPVGSGNIARNNCVWAGTLGNVHTSKGGFTATANTVADPLFLGRTLRDYRIGLTSLCLPVIGTSPVAALAS